MLNNAKPYFFLNKMNKKDLPAMYSSAVLVSVCRFTDVFSFIA